MNKHFYNPENIESFVENNLSASERASFESAMAKDPLLKNEIELQNTIIDALKQQRKAELKSRLNNIEVSLSPSYSAIKIAASVIASGIIAYGIYTFVNNDPSVATNTQTKEIKPQIAEKTSVESSQPNVSTGIEDSDPINNKVNSPSQEVTNTSTQKAIHTPTEVVSPSVHSPEMTEIENDQFQKEEKITLPDGKIAQTTETKNGIDVSVNSSTKNQFHYQFYNNKLFLFGDFNANTYEILELNTYKGKQVYFYYNKSYYLLKSNQSKTTPLQKITDKKVLAELDKINK